MQIKIALEMVIGIRGIKAYIIDAIKESYINFSKCSFK